MKASSTVQFAIIKATEGGDYRDPDFEENWNGAGDAGLIRGAYHFFTFCRPGVEQARNYLSTVPFDGAALPITIDLEFGGNCKRIPSQKEIETEVSDFVAEVQKRDPRLPIFYVTPEFVQAYMNTVSTDFPPHTRWQRNIFFEPRGSCSDWHLWQFAANGRVPGIEEVVDLNVYCGDAKRFRSDFKLSVD